MLFVPPQWKRSSHEKSRFVCVPRSARYSAQREGYCLKHKRVVFVTTRFDVGELTRARRFAASLLCFLFLIFLYFDNFAAFVKTAVGTNCVRKAHGPAVGAGCEVARNQRVVRAAVIAAALRVFALWMWGH